MTRYRHSRKLILRKIADSIHFMENDKGITENDAKDIASLLMEEAPKRKPIEKIGPVTVTAIYGTEELALAIEKVGDKVNEIIDYLNTNDRH